MRQNIKDIRHVFIREKDKSRLKYGLDININLGNFNLENVNLKKDYVTVEVSEHQTVVVNKINQVLSFEEAEDDFESFHIKNARNFWNIRIKPNTRLEKPIIIRCRSETDNSLLHFLVDVGENSEVQIIDFLEDSATKKGYNSKHIELHAGKNSRVDYYHIQKLSGGKLYHSKKTAYADKRAVISWYDINFGGNVAMSKTKTFLQGESSETNINTVFFSEKGQQFDLFAEGIHKAKNTVSRLNSKGVVNGRSKALYRSNIHITEKADSSNGNQRAAIMLICKESEGDAIPQLLIDNNNVKCSHAVTVGNLDEEKLFYLMSRGLSQDEAKHEIIKGFFNLFIERINSVIMRRELVKAVEEKISRWM